MEDLYYFVNRNKIKFHTGVQLSFALLNSNASESMGSYMKEEK